MRVNDIFPVDAVAQVAVHDANCAWALYTMTTYQVIITLFHRHVQVSACRTMEYKPAEFRAEKRLSWTSNKGSGHSISQLNIDLATSPIV